MLNHRNIFCLFSIAMILSASWAANPGPVGYTSCVAYYNFAADYDGDGIVDLAEVPNAIATTRTIGAVVNSPTWVAAPTTTTSGMATDGHAVCLNGTNQYLKFIMDTTFTSMLYSTGSVSIWMRIKFDFGSYGYLQKLPMFSQYTWSKYGMQFSLRTAFDYGWAQLNFVPCSTTVNQSASAAVVLCDEWADVGVSYDATTSKGFFTFSQYGYWYKYEFDMAGFGAILKPTGRNGYIGADYDAGLFFPGAVESVAFWNSALTEQDMKDMSFIAGEARTLSKPVSIALSLCKIVNAFI